MDTPKVQWGNTAAIKQRAMRGLAMLAVGIMVLLAVPIALALGVTENVSDSVLSLVIAAVVIGVTAGVLGFRTGLAIRSTYWLEITPTGLELWRGSSRSVVQVIPWSSIAAVAATVDPQPALWIRREPRETPTPGTELSEVGRLPVATGATADWDLGIALDPASGDPRNLEREIAARVRAPRSGSD